MCLHASKRSRSSPSDITSDISPAKTIPNCAACKTYTKVALQIAYHQHTQPPCRSGAAYDFLQKKLTKKLDNCGRALYNKTVVFKNKINLYYGEYEYE